MILRNALALRESIEVYRQSMSELAKRKGISDPHVIKISQQLDVKITILQKIINDTQSLSKAKSFYHDENKVESADTTHTSVTEIINIELEQSQ
ncbi:Spo0E like sporulation regulatory protein [Peribacillus simplex]|uniref:Spo0E like sporulation regulatory protein n=1 Tax=Peribacillus simplex TaxID=1478 RepID=A0A9X8RDJ2_9BACI|nr:aspartyl-phosphate phosphatase Spo0E family protein [Peribacillus simplex]SIS01238.1 Spo0E like sporulation regulatory protein [Peribacillus simplex]